MDPIAQTLAHGKIVAIVGLSDDPSRPSYKVAEYLQSQGYRIIPVNPRIEGTLGEKSYPDLLSIPGPIDIVDIFRRAVAVPKVVEEAIAKRAQVIWMQPGAENWEAADKAAQAGLEVVVGVCMMRRHRAMGNSQVDGDA